uniref:Uncharacterized protein n=1 Tax=Anguilla anguilla TaxID=7936 RepID=A0A0E9W7D6_ANGAN
MSKVVDQFYYRSAINIPNGTQCSVSHLSDKVAKKPSTIIIKETSSQVASSADKPEG